MLSNMLLPNMAYCYTKIISPSCDKTFDIPTYPESQLLEWKLISFVNLFIQIPNTMLNPLSISDTLVHIAHPLFPISGDTAYGPWSISGYYQNRSVIEGKNVLPWVKREKEKFLNASR